MKKFLGFLLVGILFFIGGYFISYLYSKKGTLSIGGIKTMVSAGKSAGDSLKDVLPTGEKKSEPDKAGDNEKGETKAEGDKKEEKKDSNSKEEKSEKKDEKKEEDKKLLASLWCIKKAPTPNVSDTMEGPLYIEGTSPYGMPHSFREELFAPENMLFLSEDQTYVKKNYIPSEYMSGDDQSAKDAKFWIQMGAFSSLMKAKKVASYFITKGYKVELFQGKYTDKEPSWYFVRLSESVSQEEGLKKTRVIRSLEHIVPTLIQCNTLDKRLA